MSERPTVEQACSAEGLAALRAREELDELVSYVAEETRSSQGDAELGMRIRLMAIELRLGLLEEHANKPPFRSRIRGSR